MTTPPQPGRPIRPEELLDDLRRASSDDPKERDAARFTAAARRAVAAAQDESRRTRSPHVQPEHLALGVLTGSTPLARALPELGGSETALRAALAAEIVERRGEAPERVPFGDRAEAVLALAFDEATRLGAEEVDDVHVLLAVLAEGGAESPLARLQLTSAAVEAAASGR